MDQESGRGERIRTSGLYVPNVALYQAKLHPDFSFFLFAPLAPVTGLGRAVNRPNAEFYQSFFVRGRRKHRQTHTRLLGLESGGLARGVECAGAAHDFHDVREARDLAVFDGVADQRAFIGVPRSIATSSGSVGLPSRRSSPTFLPSCDVEPS